jgi:2'-5' RNA ligase
MKMIRCFIAIEMAAEVRQALATLQDSLIRDVERGAVRWVGPDNIHLTLKFLGDTEPAAVKQLGDVLQRLARKIEPFRFHLGKLGCFPNPRRPRVIWVGIEGDLEPLLGLQRAIENDLGALGWPAEERRFQPHLTLGRVKDSRQVVAAGYPWGRVQGAAEQRVTEVLLIESVLRPAGAQYTVLTRSGLGEPDSRPG